MRRGSRLCRSRGEESSRRQGEERERERESVCCSRERVTRACVRTHRARQPGDTRTKAHTSGEETERERFSDKFIVVVVVVGLVCLW